MNRSAAPADSAVGAIEIASALPGFREGQMGRINVQSDRRKSRTACWSVFERPKDFCTTALASDAGYAGVAGLVVVAAVSEFADEKCSLMACNRSLVRPSWRKNSRWP